MSHAATNWAISVRGLDFGPFRILVYLASCHKVKTGQCNPSTKKIAQDCDTSRRTVVRCLSVLESAGLITRENRKDKTGKQETTQYRLNMMVVEV